MFGQTRAYLVLMSSHFSNPGSVSGLIVFDRALRFANTTIDAFVRVDDEHVLALVVEAVDRTCARSTASGKGVRRVTRVAASVQPAHIHDRGLGPLGFDA